MRLRLPKLQTKDIHAKAIRLEAHKNWEDFNSVFYKNDFLYVFKLIITKLISEYHNDPLSDHFQIEKTKKLFFQNYF